VGGARRAERIGIAAGLVLLATACLPAFAAAPAVLLADGSTLSVWEQHSRARRGQGQPQSSIAYSLTDVAGTHFGVVPTTDDPTADASPFLAIDETGTAVLVWSRFDGSNRKIAFARFSGGSWTDVHYLTFGPGNDDDPRIGVGRDGSYLFFIGQGEKYLYAPVELASGRLNATPRALDLGGARRDITGLRDPGSVVSFGSTDVPVVSVTPPDKRGSGSSTLRSISPQAAVDVPVVNQHTKSTIWGVGSSGGCRGLVVVVPSHDLKNAYVFSFMNGATTLLRRVGLPDPIVERFGADLAISYLQLRCN